MEMKIIKLEKIENNKYNVSKTTIKFVTEKARSFYTYPEKIIEACFMIASGKTIEEVADKIYEGNVGLADKSIANAVRRGNEWERRQKERITHEQFCESIDEETIRKEVAKEILDKVSKHFGGKWLCDIYDEYGVDYE